MGLLVYRREWVRLKQSLAARDSFLLSLPLSRPILPPSNHLLKFIKRRSLHLTKEHELPNCTEVCKQWDSLPDSTETLSSSYTINYYPPIAWTKHCHSLTFMSTFVKTVGIGISFSQAPATRHWLKGKSNRGRGYNKVCHRLQNSITIIESHHSDRRLCGR